MGLPDMSARLDEMRRSSNTPEINPLMAITNLVEPEMPKEDNQTHPKPPAQRTSARDLTKTLQESFLQILKLLTHLMHN